MYSVEARSQVIIIDMVALSLLDCDDSWRAGAGYDRITVMPAEAGVLCNTSADGRPRIDNR